MNTNTNTKTNVKTNAKTNVENNVKDPLKQYLLTNLDARRQEREKAKRNAQTPFDRLEAEEKLQTIQFLIEFLDNCEDVTDIIDGINSYMKRYQELRATATSPLEKLEYNHSIEEIALMIGDINHIGDVVRAKEAEKEKDKEKNNGKKEETVVDLTEPEK